MVVKKIYNLYRNMRSKIVIKLNKLVYGKKLLVDDGVYVRKGFTVVIEGEAFIQIGKNVFFNNYCSLNALSGITIGDDCIFGENVHIYDHNHKYGEHSIPVNSQGFTKKEIEIGKNCWIASNVIILKGVTIGDNCVIGANCVIYKDVPEDTIIKCGMQYVQSQKGNK